jgi:hypothetical protein
MGGIKRILTGREIARAKVGAGVSFEGLRLF